MFIMIDGVDGSGKSTIVQTWENTLKEQGKRVGTIKTIAAELNRLPTLEELANFDVIFSNEPTNTWVGAAIRQEMIAHETSYSGIATAEAYSLDRLILYTRLIIPLLEQGKTVIQDRGVSTSLCYQPIQDPNLTMQQVANLEGNALALKHRPDHLVIADVPAETAMTRLGGRSDKQDNAQFEKESFLTQARTSFLSEEYQSLFASRGSAIHVLNCDQPLDIMTAEATRLLQSYLG